MLPIKIKGERCYLTPVDESYAERIAGWSNDLEIGIRTGDATEMINIAQQRGYLKDMTAGQNFMIVPLDTQEPIGIIRLMSCDHIHGTATLGLFIGEKTHWNQGYGKEAINLILDYGFTILNLHNIMLYVYDFNTHAVELYKKLGFKEMGRRREAVRVGGKAYDNIYMDLLSSEFESKLLEQLSLPN